MTKTIEKILKEQLSIALRQQDVINPDHEDFLDGRILAYTHCLEIVKEIQTEQPEPETNTQARLEGSEEWNDYGDVALYEAAKQEAIKTAIDCFCSAEYEWLVEVRRDDFPAIMVKVKTFVSAEIINPRLGAE